MYRIKEIRQKDSEGQFPTTYPIGTDGTLVDMLSGLDNEVELKLGGNHDSYIEEVSDTVTRITETYYDLAHDRTYICVTTITENQDDTTTIVIVLSQNDVEIRRKTVTIPVDAATMNIREELSL